MRIFKGIKPARSLETAELMLMRCQNIVTRHKPSVPDPGPVKSPAILSVLLCSWHLTFLLLLNYYLIKYNYYNVSDYCAWLLVFKMKKALGILES